METSFEKIIIKFSVSCTEAKRKLEMTLLGFHVIFFFSLRFYLGIMQQERFSCF